MPRPTLDTIAEQAGVSKATVSRALRNHPRQSKDTCLRIQKIAHNLGYIRDPHFSALMTERRNSRPSGSLPGIALLHCLPIHYFPIPTLEDFLSGAKRKAATHGYRLEEFFLREPGMNVQRMQAILKARGIRGVIFEHMEPGGFEVEIDVSSFACLAIEYSIQKPKMHRVDPMFYNGVLLAVEKVLEKGYTRLGLPANLDAESIVYFKRRAAMLCGEYRFGNQAEFFVKSFSYGTHGYEKQVAEWIKENRIEVIMSPRRFMPEELKSCGITVPRDVGFVHLDMDSKNERNFAGIQPNWIQIGATAVEQINDQMNRFEFGEPEYPIVTYVPCNWQDGESLPDLL